MIWTMPSRGNLIPIALRIAVRNAVGGWGPYTVREIVDLFNSHGFLDRDDLTEDFGGARRTTAEEFHARIDWNDPDHAQRYLDLVAEIIEQYPSGSLEPGSPGHALRRSLERGGFLALGGRLELPGKSSSDTVNGGELDGMWRPNLPRVFFSHVITSKVEVAELADRLEDLSCSCFVAHVQIEPSRDWQEVIETALQTTHFMIAYVTPDFSESSWTDQEVGWALGRGIPVIPVNAGKQPYGFFGAYQSMKANSKQSVSVSMNIFRALVGATFRSSRPSNALVEQSLSAAIVTSFCASPNYDSTRQRFPLLGRIPIGLWTDSMLRQLEESANRNRQIEQAFLTDHQPYQRVPDAIADLVTRIRESRRSQR